MKRFLSLLLGVSILMSALIVSNAATLTQPGSSSNDIFIQNTEYEEVTYSVDVIWTDMDSFGFNIDIADAVWDPAVHAYKDAEGNIITTGAWNGKSSVEVVNHSNVPVKAGISASPLEIEGSTLNQLIAIGVSTTDIALESGQGKTHADAASATSEFTIGFKSPETTKLDKTFEDYTSIGNATVTLLADYFQPYTVPGRILGIDKTGDSVNWIELARSGDASLIMRVEAAYWGILKNETTGTFKDLNLDTAFAGCSVPLLEGAIHRNDAFSNNKHDTTGKVISRPTAEKTTYADGAFVLSLSEIEKYFTGANPSAAINKASLYSNSQYLPEFMFLRRNKDGYSYGESVHMMNKDFTVKTESNYDAKFNIAPCLWVDSSVFN